MKNATFEMDFHTTRFNNAGDGLRALARNASLSMDSASRALIAELKAFLRDVTREVAARHSGAYPGGTGPASLSVRSGRAVASILASPQVTGTTFDTIRGEVGGIGYLRSHEYGATIKPRQAKYLTIPLKAALNPDGTPIKASARQWDRTFVITSKKGNLLIVRRDGANLVPLYVLKTEVTIPARLGYRATLARGVPEFAYYAPARMVERMVREHFA